MGKGGPNGGWSKTPTLAYDRAKPRVAFEIVVEGDEPYLCGLERS